MTIKFHADKKRKKIREILTFPKQQQARIRSFDVDGTLNRFFEHLDKQTKKHNT